MSLELVPSNKSFLFTIDNCRIKNIVKERLDKQLQTDYKANKHSQKLWYDQIILEKLKPLETNVGEIATT